MEKYIDSLEDKRQETQGDAQKEKKLASVLDSLAGQEFVLLVPFARETGDDQKE